MAQAQLKITNETTIKKRSTPIEINEAIEILRNEKNYINEIPFRPKGEVSIHIYFTFNE